MLTYQNWPSRVFRGLSYDKYSTMTDTCWVVTVDSEDVKNKITGVYPNAIVAVTRAMSHIDDLCPDSKGMYIHEEEDEMHLKPECEFSWRMQRYDIGK